MKNNKIKSSIKILTCILLCVFSFLCGYKINKYSETKIIKILENQITELQKNFDLLSNNNIPHKYPKDETITFDDYLYEDFTQREKKSRFNLYGEIEYKNKIVINEKGSPLTIKNARSSAEIISIGLVEGVEPEQGCDLYPNGILCCYWYYFKEGKKKIIGKIKFII